MPLATLHGRLQPDVGNLQEENHKPCRADEASTAAGAGASTGTAGQIYACDRPKFGKDAGTAGKYSTAALGDRAAAGCVVVAWKLSVIVMSNQQPEGPKGQ